MIYERFLDNIMFRKHNPLKDSETEPIVTTGSILYGFSLRLILIIFACFGLFEYFDFYGNWIVTVLLIWLVAVYPAYRQYELFNYKIEKIQIDTLCGKCAFFDESNQLCKPLDQHVLSEEPPCEGNMWEPSARRLDKIKEEKDNREI